MKNWKILAVAVPILFGAPAALAQDVEAEARAEELEKLEKEEYKARLAEAEAELAEAAARVAELSMQNLPEIVRIEENIVSKMGRPRLGVTIASDDPKEGPVEGVRVLGVTPGSAAADAGLRSGDILTSADDEDLGASTQGDANERLLNFMMALDEGEKIEIGYLRDGNVGSVTVEPRVVEGFAFVMPDMSELGESMKMMQRVAGDHASAFAFRFGASWGDMELVELSEGLGRYFGTDQGLLVISAPKSGALELQDGDVIQSIDGREPTSVNHAIRILGTYEPGEKLELAIMRDKRRRTLDVEMPDNRQSRMVPAPSVAPTAPVPPVPPAPLLAPPDPEPARYIRREVVRDTRT